MISEKGEKRWGIPSPLGVSKRKGKKEDILQRGLCGEVNRARFFRSARGREEVGGAK